MKNLLLLLSLLANLAYGAVCTPVSALEIDTTKNDVYYFVSNRSNQDGKYTMYKARTNQSGISSVLIKGNFEVEGFSHMRKAEIAVYNISNDKLVGIYNTNPKTGNYLIILVPNVKYEFVINSYGYAPIKKIVEIPHYASTNVSDEISHQKMMLRMKEQGVSLTVNTNFVEEKEPTLFLLTVYNENKEEHHHVELYQANDDEFNELTNRNRRNLKETEFGDIDELLKAEAEAESKKPEVAEKAFKERDYSTASKLYAQLLKLDKEDPIYNYRMGVSLFNTELNKLKAVPFLKKAMQSKDIPVDGYYFLARAYHLWSNFADAQLYYTKFKEKATEKQLANHNIDRLIENCVVGKKLMEEQLNMETINKSPIELDKLPKGYPTSLVSEKLEKKTKFFVSPIDEKKKAKLMMFKTEQNEMIQASYGLKDEGQKDLYVNMLIGSDRWGAPTKLDETINTKYDEDHAYVTLDGKTMYFSSKGHDGIGGYDIFKTTRKSSTSPWGKPENLGYPINSPYDDVLFMPDFKGEFAYFSSNRRSPTGGFQLYKIKMPKAPMPLTVIKGHFMTSDSIPDFYASIAVYNTNNQEIVGIYNTNANNGNYLMALMPGIKYEFILECDGFKEHTAYITVPIQTEMYALRQNIRLKKEKAFEIMKVDNYFTQEEAQSAPVYTKTAEDFKDKSANLPLPEAPTIQEKFNKPTPQQLQLLSSAEQFFVNKQYLKAVQQFEKVAPLIKLNSKQSYYYGKALFSVSREFEKILTHLEAAAMDKNTPYDVFFMLGKTNHNAYRFERAAKAYERYKTFASEKEIEMHQIDNEINLSRFGQKLVNEPKPIEVLAAKEFSMSNLHTIYNSVDLSAKFLQAPEDMIMPKDRKENFKPTMYLNESKTMIYFASYGETGETGKDIYLMRKLPNNTWTSAIKLSDVINTTGDEDYPYLAADGKTLYFCSTAHGSMGGYDIYKSIWNEKKQKWSKPINLGAPINSPFDDLYFVE